MLFGVKLANEAYPPWKEHYIAYDHLKDFLKEDETKQNKDKNNKNKNKNNKIWSDKDEIKFVEALDKELEKVYTFQSNTYNEVLERLNLLEDELDKNDITCIDFVKFQSILENSLVEAQELDNFSRLNFTGFTKIVKKHDKLHPQFPSVKSLFLVRLKELPFHSEEYSPLLYKISFLYNIFRLNNPNPQQLTSSVGGGTLGNGSLVAFSASLSQSAKLNSVSQAAETQYDTFKFWIHPDNLVEVKTRILRHLPVLVYASLPNENNDLINRLESGITTTTTTTTGTTTTGTTTTGTTTTSNNNSDLVGGDGNDNTLESITQKNTISNSHSLGHPQGSSSSNNDNNNNNNNIGNKTGRGSLGTSDGDSDISSSNSEEGIGSDNNGNKNGDLQNLDPVITCLYFDNEMLDLYNKKLLKVDDYSTLRLRWTGRLVNKPDIFMEKKTFTSTSNNSHETGVDDIDGENNTDKSLNAQSIDRMGVSKNKILEGGNSSNQDSDFKVSRLKIKPKFINGFINGNSDYKDKMVYKLKQAGNEIGSEKLEKDCNEIQKFAVTNDLEPVLRTMYIRTAFQIPGDNKVRITIDSNILFIREDTFDEERPIRDPNSWHRSDIDSSVSNPLKFLRNGEFNKFPYSVMEIKVKRPQSATHNVFKSPASYSSKHSKWISELTNSHLVKEVPNFSKFVQGIASFFSEDDKLDYLPFWLPDVDSGIKIDPQQAFEEEQLKLKKEKESQNRKKKLQRFSVSNYSNQDPDFEFIRSKKSSSTDPSVVEQVQSSVEQSLQKYRLNDGAENQQDEGRGDIEESSEEDDEDNEENAPLLSGSQKRANKKSKNLKKLKTMKRDPNFFKILTNPKLTNIDSEDEEVELPPGVKKPTQYLKNAGPVKVEAKVWLANERTFNRWLHVTTLLSILTFSVYNSTKNAAFPRLATYLAYVYFALSVLSGLWAYRTYIRRLNVIQQRSGQHLDAPLGPLVLAAVVSITLIVNFVAAFKSCYSQLYGNGSLPVEDPASLIFSITASDAHIYNNSPLPTALQPIQDFIFKLVNSI